MKNPAKKSQGFGEENNFEKVLASALKDPYISFEDPKIGKWIESFVRQVRPLLEELYCKYKIAPEAVFVWAAYCKFAPAPQEFPKELRNRRQRERMAGRLERAADDIYNLESARMYAANLCSDPTVDIVLKAAAARIRKRESIPGRPKSYIMKDYATVQAALFRDWGVSSLYSHVATLLK